MARKVRDSRLDARSSRLKLKPRREPYWRSVAKGFAIGYRRCAAAGTWIARAYLPDRRPSRTYESLGLADDILDADAEKVLTFDQAQAKGAAWFATLARDGSERPTDGPYTIATACRDYLKWFEAHRRSHSRTKAVVEVHILPTLGFRDAAKLTPTIVRQWHEAMALAPRRVRSKQGQAQRFRDVGNDFDERRRRRSTANRILTVLKAALNHAWRDGKIASDDAWRKVKPFSNVDAPVKRYLTSVECVRLVNAASHEFRPLVRAAILTGCRYSELSALKVSDFNPDGGTVVVRASKTGRPRHVVLTDEALAFFEAATAGRPSQQSIFLRADATVWGPSHQQRPMFEACGRARIRPAVSFHILRHTHGSLLAMQGVPMAVIAEQLGHADTRMTEKHYAHLSPSYVKDTIRKHFGPLGIVEPGSQVRALERVKVVE